MSMTRSFYTYYNPNVCAGFDTLRIEYIPGDEPIITSVHASKMPENETIVITRKVMNNPKIHSDLITEIKEYQEMCAKCMEDDERYDREEQRREWIEHYNEIS